MGCVKSGFRGGNGAQKNPMHTVGKSQLQVTLLACSSDLNIRPTPLVPKVAHTCIYRLFRCFPV